MSDEISNAVLESVKVRITRVFPAQIRHCLEQLSDDEIWSRPNEASNSVGNIVLHLTGSLNHYLNHKLGTLAFQRDRAGEFAERRRIPKSELLAGFDEMVTRGEETLNAMSVQRLADESPEPNMNRLVVEDLLNIGFHLSTHTGQILWITKMFHGGAIDDLWIRTHKTLGAWRR
ncbi:MAG: hypothetical protein NVSMB68_13970 [Thermoanaerobaculia bacterium]